MHAIQPLPVPLVRADDGVIRVQGTRIPLETVAHAFESGATAEEIVQQFPTLQLADVYAIIAWILQHGQEVADYVAEQESAREQVRAEAERRFPPHGIRARLLARRQA